jgi:hypothetical protein
VNIIQGVKFRVELANEGDVTALARLYCECFKDLLTHIGLPADAGPEVVEGLWRSFGTLTVRRCVCDLDIHTQREE